MAAAEEKIDYIPNLIIGKRLYSNYPIRYIELDKAEELLTRSKPGVIIIRTSNNSKSKGGYYVASFDYNRKFYNILITREDHDGGMGDLTEIIKRKFGVDMDFSNYTLPILRQSPVYASQFKNTTEESIPSHGGYRKYGSHRKKTRGRKKTLRRRSTRK